MAQLKEGSVIKKSTGDEIIATINDLEGGSIVDLGTFNDETELITHVVMNQLPTGHYAFIVTGFPTLMLLRTSLEGYFGTLNNSDVQFFYFNVSIYGEIQEAKTINFREFMTDVPM